MNNQEKGYLQSALFLNMAKAISRADAYSIHEFRVIMKPFGISEMKFSQEYVNAFKYWYSRFPRGIHIEEGIRQFGNTVYFDGSHIQGSFEYSKDTYWQNINDFKIRNMRIELHKTGNINLELLTDKAVSEFITFREMIELMKEAQNIRLNTSKFIGMNSNGNNSASMALVSGQQANIEPTFNDFFSIIEGIVNHRNSRTGL